MKSMINHPNECMLYSLIIHHPLKKVIIQQLLNFSIYDCTYASDFLHWICISTYNNLRRLHLHSTFDINSRYFAHTQNIKQMLDELVWTLARAFIHVCNYLYTRAYKHAHKHR